GMMEPHETVSYAGTSRPEWHDRIIRHWKTVIEHQFKLSYMKPGHGIWNVLFDALSLGHSQLPRKLTMIDAIRNHEQLNVIEDLINAADDPKPEASTNLFSFILILQEACQIGVVQTNTAGSYPAKQLTCCGSDCSTKPDQTEAADVYKAFTCKQCGMKANEECSLFCDGCEAVYHFSCIKPAIEEISTPSWFCDGCSKNKKDSADQADTEPTKGSLHQNCVVCDRLEVSESLEDLDENGSRTRLATDSGESSVSSMESEEPPEPSRTAVSSLCKICGTCEDEDKKFLVCGHLQCPYKFYHIRCLKSSQIASPQQQNRPCWYCASCLCRACLCDKDDDKIVLCDGCDEAYHTYCMKPPRTTVPKGQWYCVPCNVARAREGMRRYEQWILQQHGKNEGRQPNEAIGSMDLLLSAAEKLSSEEKLASGQ
ncbi:hypothetical protein B296_00057567, partial [Ensete ventricosum]